MPGKRPVAQVQADIVAVPAAAAAAGTAAGAQGCWLASGIAVAAPVAVPAAAGTAAGAAHCLVASDTELEDLYTNMKSEDTMTRNVQGSTRQAYADQDGLVKGVESSLDTAKKTQRVSNWMQKGTDIHLRGRHKASSSPAKASLEQNRHNFLVALRCSSEVVPTWLTISGRSHRPGRRPASLRRRSVLLLRGCIAGWRTARWHVTWWWPSLWDI